MYRPGCVRMYICTEHIISITTWDKACSRNCLQSVTKRMTRRLLRNVRDSQVQQKHVTLRVPYSSHACSETK